MEGPAESVEVRPVKFCVMRKKNEVKAPVGVKRRQPIWGKIQAKIEMHTAD